MARALQNGAVSGGQRITSLDRVRSIGRCVVERLSELEKVRIAELAALGCRRGSASGGPSFSVALRRYVNRLRRPSPPARKRSPLRLSLIEREEISRGWPVESRCGPSRGGWVDRRRRSRGRCIRNGGVRRYRACRADRAALRRAATTEDSEARAVSTVAGVVEAQARGALVAAADLRLAGASVPRRSGDARVARDDLSVAVRAVPRRAAQGADRVISAPGTSLAGPRAFRHEWSRAAPRHAQHSANDPPKPMTGPCPATGKATSSSARA